LSVEEIRELCGAAPAAAVYHIDGVAGNDLNDGLSRETAFKTIQKGIDASDDGDEVVVWPGLYQEAINFKGKAIAVKSAAEPAVIEATGMDAVTFHAAEGPGSVLKNFIIRNSGMALSTNYGSSPTISNLTIVNNEFGIAAYGDSDPNVSNCIIWNNKYGDLFGCEARYSWVQQELEPDLEDPNGGLVSHWAFDEGAGLIAYDSAGTKDGVVFGAKWASGQLGGALDFDGADDYVALPDNNPVWLPQNSFALSAWVYFDRAPAASGGETFLDLNFADSGTPSNELGYVVSRAGAGYAGRVAFGMTTLTNTDEDLHSNEVLSGGRWYHVVAVRDGTTQAIYIDGQLDNSRTCSPDPIDFVGGYDDDKVNIGRVTSTGVGQYYVDGKIDDVRIYDRALSASEVLQLYEPVAGIDPLFADPAGGDYHLLSERGRYWPAHDVWVLDRKTSPCIDAGDPAVDPSGEPMPNGGRINIGAYGGTVQASLSEWAIASDYNRDGRTNFEDFAIFCEEWLATFPWADGQPAPPEPEPDLAPPTPNPATWDVEPYSTSSTVSMSATAASDENGVEYYFQNMTVGGRASGWQASNNWTDTGLVPSTQYCYRVKTRDKSPNMNESAWSSTSCATTSSGGR
jgi:parallel beta-helix repeat protein